MNFSTLSNNTQETNSEFIYIFPDDVYNNFYFSFCNFIKNIRKNGYSDKGLIHSVSNSVLADCVFIGNEKSPLFGNGRQEFPLTVRHCFVDEISEVGKVVYEDEREDSDKIKLRVFFFNDLQANCDKCSDDFLVIDNSIYYMMIYAAVLSIFK